MFDTIVIATDGSKEGDRAFALATAIARAESARLVVTHVVELVGGKGGVYPVAADEDDLEKKLAAHVAELQADGLKVELVTETVHLGGPAHVIADVAESVNADLIVVGSTGHSAMSEIVLGSVPLRLMHIAHRPVLVVPPPKAHAAADDGGSGKS